MHFFSQNKLLFLMSVLLIFGARAWSECTPSTVGKPRITVVMPYDYCGEFLLYIYEIPDAESNQVDSFHVFNLEGDHGVVAKVPDASMGWLAGFTFYDSEQRMNKNGYFQVKSYSSAGTIYNIRPYNKENCKEEFTFGTDGISELIKQWYDSGILIEPWQPKLNADAEILYTKDGDWLKDREGNSIIRYWTGNSDSFFILIRNPEVSYGRDSIYLLNEDGSPKIVDYSRENFFLIKRDANGKGLYDELGKPILIFHEGK